METEALRDGEYYYWIRSDTGDICESVWCSSKDSCWFRWSIGNVFRKYSDAKLAIATRQHEVEDIRGAYK